MQSGQNEKVAHPERKAKRIASAWLGRDRIIVLNYIIYADLYSRLFWRSRIWFFVRVLPIQHLKTRLWTVDTPFFCFFWKNFQKTTKISLTILHIWKNYEKNLTLVRGDEVAGNKMISYAENLAFPDLYRRLRRHFASATIDLSRLFEPLSPKGKARLFSLFVNFFQLKKYSIVNGEAS